MDARMNQHDTSIREWHSERLRSHIEGREEVK